MAAAVVLRDHFDVFVTVTPIELVLETEIGKMNRLVEVRQVVFARPFLDFSRVPIGSTVAVWAAAVVFLEKALVLSLQIVLQYHAPDLRALLAQTFLGTQVGAIERGVVRQLAGPADPGAELLVTLAAVPTVTLE
jgi:hypothetical protein